MIIAATAGSSWYSVPVATIPVPTVPTQSATPVLSLKQSRISREKSTSASVK